jgi:hypothetical protein
MSEAGPAVREAATKIGSAIIRSREVEETRICNAGNS